MFNDLLKIGPVTIHGYGLMIGIGILCALLGADKRAKSKGLNASIIYSLGISALIIGFVCAKLLYCIVDIGEFMNNPMAVLSGNGFVVYGGLIGGILTAAFCCKFKKVSFLKYFDLAAPSIALAQGFGRIGCFLAGCCYGRETDSCIGIVFHKSLFAPNQIRLIPTQLISSAGNFLIAIILLLYDRKGSRSGKTGALYLALYSVGRFVIEFFRNDYRGNVGMLSTSQFISIIVFAIGGAMFFVDAISYIGKRKGLV
jgi:phosphatidylglycerol:prolipoprotein diacylglycerol transferase